MKSKTTKQNRLTALRSSAVLGIRCKYMLISDGKNHTLKIFNGQKSCMASLKLNLSEAHELGKSLLIYSK